MSNKKKTDERSRLFLLTSARFIYDSDPKQTYFKIYAHKFVATYAPQQSNGISGSINIFYHK